MKYGSPEYWYKSCEAHISTALYGDIPIQTIHYDWCNDPIEVIAEKLREEYPELTDTEVYQLYDLATDVRIDADEFWANLNEADRLYSQGKTKEAMSCLLVAEEIELDRGWLATKHLWKQMFGEERKDDW